MQTHEIGPLIAGLLSESVDGAAPGGDAYILNSGDAGLLGSLDKLDAGEGVPQHEWRRHDCRARPARAVRALADESLVA